jgi:hypothetical protein
MGFGSDRRLGFRAAKESELVISKNSNIYSPGRSGCFLAKFLGASRELNGHTHTVV